MAKSEHNLNNWRQRAMIQSSRYENLSQKNSDGEKSLPLSGWLAFPLNSPYIVTRVSFSSLLFTAVL